MRRLFRGLGALDAGCRVEDGSETCVCTSDSPLPSRQRHICNLHDCVRSHSAVRAGNNSGPRCQLHRVFLSLGPVSGWPVQCSTTGPGDGTLDATALFGLLFRFHTLLFPLLNLTHGPRADPIFPVQRRPRAHGSHPQRVGRFLAKTLAKRGCKPTTRHPCAFRLWHPG